MERELLNFDWFYKYDQANYFLEQYFLQAKTLCYEEIEKQFLDIYYPYVKNDDGTSVRQYIGGLTLDMANQKYNEYLDRIREIHIAMETSSYLYSTYFVTFEAEYSVVAMHSLDELASKSGDYTIKIQDYYNKAIESLRVACGTLFRDAEAAMYNFSMDDTYLEKLSAMRINMDNLSQCAELATTTYKEITPAKEIIESECPDVKEYYLSLLLYTEEYDYDNIIRNYPLQEVIFDEGQTASYIKAMNEFAAKMRSIVSNAKDAQIRYKYYSDALNDATAEIDAMQAAVKNECPDVWTDYIENWEHLRSLLNDLAGSIGDIALDMDNSAVSNFYSALTDLLNQAKEISDKAHAAQSGFTDVDDVEVSETDGAVYYNVNGEKVSNPTAGTMLIKVNANGKTQKVVVR